MTIEWPSSKWWVGVVSLVAVAGTAYLQAATDVPEWLPPVVAVAGAVAMYLKPERRPSSSARAAALDADTAT